MIVSEQASMTKNIFGGIHLPNEPAPQMTCPRPSSPANMMQKKTQKASTLPVPRSFLHGTNRIQQPVVSYNRSTSQPAKTKHGAQTENKSLTSQPSLQTSHTNTSFTPSLKENITTCSNLSQIPRNRIPVARNLSVADCNGEDTERRSTSCSSSSSSECLQYAGLSLLPRGSRTRATLPMASVPYGASNGLSVRQRRATIPRAGPVTAEDDATVPPKTVANLASKFNALIERNQAETGVAKCPPAKIRTVLGPCSKPPPSPQPPKLEVSSIVTPCRKVSYVQKLVINFEGASGESNGTAGQVTPHVSPKASPKTTPKLVSRGVKSDMNRHFSSNLELSSRKSELSECRSDSTKVCNDTAGSAAPSVMSHIRKYNSLDAVEKTEETCNDDVVSKVVKTSQYHRTVSERTPKLSSIPIPQPRRHFTVQLPPLPKQETMYSNSKVAEANEQSLRPNPSFLWDRKITQKIDTMQQREKMAIPVPTDVNLCRDDSAEDPIYEQLPFVPQPSQDVEPHYKVPVSILTEGDEGWEDVSEDEEKVSQRAEFVQNGENVIMNNVKSRIRRKGQMKTSLRRSWSQSLRDLTINQNETRREPTSTRHRCDASEEDYQDVSASEDERESESNYSDSTNPEHHYESVYDMIAASVHSTEDRGCRNDAEEEEEEGGDSLEWNESQETVRTLRSDTNTEDCKRHPSPRFDDYSKPRRQWSLTKSDIRQELAMTISKFKKKKSPTEDVANVSPTSPTKSKKRNWASFRPKLGSRKADKISLKRSPSPKKESATFYLQSVVLVQSTEPVPLSVITRTSPAQYSSSDSTDSGSQKYGEFAGPAVTVNVPCGSFATNSHTRRRRRTVAGSALPRPKTAPPAPPVPPHRSSLVNLTQKGGSVDGSECYSSENSYGSSCDQRPGVVKRMDSSDSDAYGVTSLPFMRRSSEGTGHSLDIMKSRMHLPLPDPLNDETSNKAKLRSSSSGSEMSYLEYSETTSTYGSCKISPFVDEPLYQIYIRDAVERAVRQNQMENSDEDYETLYPNTTLQPSKKSAMELVLPNASGQRTLWCELPEVQSSGLLKTISAEMKRLQEAMFEVITSEASYLKSLDVLTRHFIRCPQFSPDSRILSRSDRDTLFGNILGVKKVSERLLADLEKRWHESLLIGDICDIIYEHASKHFDVYVTYVSNQVCQDRLLRKLKDTNSQFAEVLKQLEMNPICHNLSMYSFLMLPMQRITRLPLLIDAIYNRLTVDCKQSDSCKLALAAVNKVVHECNEGARKVEEMQEMLALEQKLKFSEVKAIPLVTGSRWLVKKGEVTRLLLSETSSKLSFGRWAGRSIKQLVYFFLFTDLLVISKKKNNNCYIVIDYCPRNMIEVTELDNLEKFFEKPPEGCRNPFQLCIFQNHEHRMVEMIFSCTLESDRLRWTEALTPIKSENPDERIYEEWDCPQVQVTHTYIAEQPDELSLEEADVVNVFRKMADGWYQGERIRDGLQGWFPSSYTKEIVSAHVRSRNLRQRYRLLTLSQSYLEEQKRKEKPAKDK